MAPSQPYNDRIRSIIQMSQAVRNTPYLLEKFEGDGAASSDLDYIIDQGVSAANAKSATLAASGDSQAATAAKRQAFIAIGDEDATIKAAVRAVVELDIALKKIGPEAAGIRLRRILDNDTEVTVTDFTAEGQKKRRVKKSRSDEARRQEI